MMQLNPPHTSHDTIAMVALDRDGHVAAAASTNGASHKVPGRVGDASFAGAGVYAEDGVGGAVMVEMVLHTSRLLPPVGCGATGDGDIHLRFAPCLHVVLLMRAGWSPGKATEAVVRRMGQWYPSMQSALVAVDAQGRHGAACWGWTFVYNVMKGEHPEIVTVQPLKTR